MSARRRYAIECDGPACSSTVPTTNPFVDVARSVAKSNGWWRVGESKERALDFCTEACERSYAETNPPHPKGKT